MTIPPHLPLFTGSFEESVSELNILVNKTNDILFAMTAISALATGAMPISYLSTDGTMVSDSAVLVPSQSAVVTYVAARISAISDNDSAYALITGATFSGAISATNLSGTNTGDQTNITGNAGTVTTINARIAAGANITLTGAGTAASPYSIAATVGSSLTGFTDDSTDFNNALGGLF